MGGGARRAGRSPVNGTCPPVPITGSCEGGCGLAADHLLAEVGPPRALGGCRATVASAQPGARCVQGPLLLALQHPPAPAPPLLVQTCCRGRDDSDGDPGPGPCRGDGLTRDERRGDERRGAAGRARPAPRSSLQAGGQSWVPSLAPDSCLSSSMSAPNRTLLPQAAKPPRPERLPASTLLLSRWSADRNVGTWLGHP